MIKKFFIFFLLIIMSKTFALCDNFININLSQIKNKIVYECFYEVIIKRIKKEPTLKGFDLFQKEIATNIVKSGLKYNINPLLIYNIIKVESNFNIYAVSDKNAKGLMQLRDIAVKDLIGNNIKSDKIFNISTNIDLGVRYLKKMLNYTDYNIPLALTYYNRGIGNVNKDIKKGVNITKLIINKYVKKILKKEALQ